MIGLCKNCNQSISTHNRDDLKSCCKEYLQKLGCSNPDLAYEMLNYLMVENWRKGKL